MMIQIDKNIPLPKERPNWKKQLEKLEVGDSFPVEEVDRHRVAVSISTHFHSKGAKRFKTGPDPEQAGRIRVWRKK